MAHSQRAGLPSVRLQTAAAGRTPSSSSSSTARVPSLEGLAVIGQGGQLPPTVRPTYARERPLALEAPPSVAVRSSPGTARPPAPAAGSTPTSTRALVRKKAPAAKPKGGGGSAKKKSTKAVPGVKKAPPKEVPTEPAPARSGPAIPSSQAAAASPPPAPSFPPRIAVQSDPFPEYAAAYARANASILQTAHALTEPYMPPPLPTRRSGIGTIHGVEGDEQTLSIAATSAVVVEPVPTGGKPLRTFTPDAHGHLHIHLTDLEDAVEFVHTIQRRTPLFLDESLKIDAFYTYNPTQLVEAKKLFLAKMHGAATVDDQLEELRRQLLTAMRYGHCLLLSLTDSAVDFLQQYNSPTSFPTRALFQPTLFQQESTYSALLRPADVDDPRGIWYAQKAIHPEFRLVVTSQFEAADAESFLRESIPLDHCTIVHIQQPEGGSGHGLRSAMKELKFLKF